MAVKYKIRIFERRVRESINERKSRLCTQLKELLKETEKKIQAVDGSVDRAAEIGDWNLVQAYSDRLHDCIGLSFIDSFIPDKIYEFSYSSFPMKKKLTITIVRKTVAIRIGRVNEHLLRKPVDPSVFFSI